MSAAGKVIRAATAAMFVALSLLVIPTAQATPAAGAPDVAGVNTAGTSAPGTSAPGASAPGASAAGANTAGQARPASVLVPEAPTPTAGDDAFAALDGCLVKQKAGDVLIMLDKSGSIADSDPGGLRITAAKSLLSSLLARVADPSSGISGAKITVAVATFGEAVFQGKNQVDPANAAWSNLDSADVPTIDSQLDTDAADHTGKETDYWTALDWIAKAEQVHSNNNAAAGCHLVFWFTDGMYGIASRNDGQKWPNGLTKSTPWTPTASTQIPDVTTATAVQQGGQADICRNGGLADQLRSENLTMAAVGLGSTTQFGLLQQIAENTNKDCGALPGIGKFFPVTGGSLLFDVDALGDNSTPGPIDPQKVCESDVDCTFKHSFSLDSSLRRVHIVGVPSVAGLKVEIISPAGQKATFDAPTASSLLHSSSTTVAGIKTDWEWVSDQEITINLSRPDETTSWTGTWSVIFVDTTGKNKAALASTRVSLSADLALAFVSSKSVDVEASEALTDPVALVSLSGGPAVLAATRPSMKGTLTLLPLAPGSKPFVLSSSLDGNNASSLTQPWSVPSDVPSGPAQLQVSLVVTTVSGVVLDPVIRYGDVNVKPAPDSPTIVSRSVDFGSIEGTGSATANLSVTGPGCLWVTGGNLVASPSSVKSVNVSGGGTSSSNCTSLTAGQRQDITLTASPAQEGNGQVEGEATVHMSPAGHPDQVKTQPLLYTMSLSRSALVTVFIGILIAALVIGIGLPIGVLWLTRRIAARYPSDVQLSAVRIPVLVGPRGVMAMAGGAPSLPDAWSSVPPPSDGRRTLLVEGVKLRARSGKLWSAKAGYSETVDRPGTADDVPYFGGRGLHARLPLGVQGTWSVLFRNTEELAGPQESVPGDLLLITHPSTNKATRTNLLTEAVGQAPALVADLRDAARAATGIDESSGGTGPGPVGSGPGEPGPGFPNQPTPGWPGQNTGWPTGGQPMGPAGAPGPTGGSPTPGWNSGPAGTQPPQPGWGAANPGPPPGNAGGFSGAPNPAQAAPGRRTDNPAPPPPGWGAGNPTRPPGSGWGGVDSGRVPSPGWGEQEPGSPPSQGWGAEAAPKPPAQGWGAEEPPKPPAQGWGESPPPSGWPTGGPQR